MSSLPSPARRTQPRDPWETTYARWSADEVAHALRLTADGLNYAEIADALAFAGYPPRDDTAVSNKIRNLVGESPPASPPEIAARGALNRPVPPTQGLSEAAGAFACAPAAEDAA